MCLVTSPLYYYDYAVSRLLCQHDGTHVVRAEVSDGRRSGDESILRGWVGAGGNMRRDGRWSAYIICACWEVDMSL